MAGVTFSARATGRRGRRTNTRRSLEEAYLYIDMPAPAFGVQFVYTDKRRRSSR